MKIEQVVIIRESEKEGSIEFISGSDSVFLRFVGVDIREALSLNNDITVIETVGRQ